MELSAQQLTAAYDTGAATSALVAADGMQRDSGAFAGRRGRGHLHLT
eukprot:CAMPEP_0119074946 /NCGR_PEP_ID=MMETSP1178-20130426/75176_1 /TAXON_ID=33656 /ORGANISM="unid sp, Strain CCMP2000" /LENGTH=46 /DNA_ID= /DNA_START= /DNA_END= /DNA_ORIENTATION=